MRVGVKNELDGGRVTTLVVRAWLGKEEALFPCSVDYREGRFWLASHCYENAMLVTLPD